MERAATNPPAGPHRQFRGRVRAVVDGPALCEVDVETPSGLVLTSLVRKATVEALGLRPGRAVVARVSASEVALSPL